MCSTVELDTSNIDWSKVGGLIPAIVQDTSTGSVLMLGYMSSEALQHTLSTGKVTFYSRSRESLWTKGETSGNFLRLKKIWLDCDRDTLLVLAAPDGPTCHKGTTSCFGDTALRPTPGFLRNLEDIIRQRSAGQSEKSYTASLLNSGPKRIAQKVGEEGVEVALAAMEPDNESLLEEAGDLMYHLLVLLNSRGLELSDVERVLEGRSKKNPS